MIRNTSWKWISGASAALLGVALAGCGGQNDAASDTTVAMTDNTTSTAAAPMDDRMASGAGYEDVAKTWGQIEMAKADLDKVVMDKKLKQVHESAFKIRDLVKTLPAQSASLSEDKRKTLDAHVTEVTQLAGMLDEAGDAGNEKSTHDHHMALNDALVMIQAVYPAGALGSNMHMPGMKKAGGDTMSGSGMTDDKMSGAMPGGGMADDKMGGSMVGSKPTAKPMPMRPAAKKPMPAGGMGDDMDMPMGGGMGHM